VRIAEDMRQSAVFFGYPDTSPGKGGIDCIGTGFLWNTRGAPYLVTAKHLALEVRDDPFLIRLNKRAGTSDNLPVDGVQWFHHPESTVDVSVIPFLVPRSAGYENTYIQPKFIMTNDKMKRYDIGVGSLVYTVGLFRLLAGEKRNSQRRVPPCLLLNNCSRHPVHRFMSCPLGTISKRSRLEVCLEDRLQYELERTLHLRISSHYALLFASPQGLWDSQLFTWATLPCFRRMSLFQ